MNEHVNAITVYGASETVPDWTITCQKRGYVIKILHLCLSYLITTVLLGSQVAPLPLLVHVKTGGVTMMEMEVLESFRLS